MIFLDSLLGCLLLYTLHILAANIATTDVVWIDEFVELCRLEMLLDHSVVRGRASFTSKAQAGNFILSSIETTLL